MYAGTADDGRRRTVQQIADELGVKRAIVYGYRGVTSRIFLSR
jgi:hypothetical protein